MPSTAAKRYALAAETGVEMNSAIATARLALAWPTMCRSSFWRRN